MSESLHKLNRPKQVILFRLKTGHNRLNAHMNSKFKVGESEMCNKDVNKDVMTAQQLSASRCSEAGHVARTTTTEGQAL